MLVAPAWHHTCPGPSPSQRHQQGPGQLGEHCLGSFCLAGALEGHVAMREGDGRVKGSINMVCVAQTQRTQSGEEGSPSGTGQHAWHSGRPSCYILKKLLWLHKQIREV